MSSHYQDESFPHTIKIRVSQDPPQVEGKEIPKSPMDAAPTIHETKKRPRLDLGAPPEGRERKRGKSMFGLLVGTLNKAKIEDKERNASDAVSDWFILLSAF